jgi:hypothetical protein
MSYTRFQIRLQVKRASRCDKVAKRSEIQFKFRRDSNFKLQGPRTLSFGRSGQPPNVRQDSFPETRDRHGPVTTYRRKNRIDLCWDLR